MHILLVEDNPVTAKSIELKLAAEGHNVFVTDMGEDAIEFAGIYDYDLILLDLDLSDMSGLDVLRAMRDQKDPDTDDYFDRLCGRWRPKVKALSAGMPMTSSPNPSTRPNSPRGSMRS